MKSALRIPALSGLALALAACASLPREQGYDETRRLVESRRGIAPAVPAPTASKATVPTEPLDAHAAVRLAFANHPRVRESYARIGLGRADLEESRRLTNPRFGFGRLSVDGGAGAQITRSLSWGLSDLILLPTRNRLAKAEMAKLQNEVASELLAFATEAEVAWFEAASAQQVAAMREIVARAAVGSAELAQRFHAAGNISRLQLAQEQAAASIARIEAARATSKAMQARANLSTLMALPVDGAWQLASGLPLPPVALPDADALVALAMESRLDLAAAREAIALREDALGVTRRWRWLGSAEIGYERESEPDGGRKRGPHLEFELPLFGQGQGRLERANAELQRSRAQLDALALSVHAAARSELDRMAVAQDVAQRYRDELVPLQEAIVARTQERYDFMLVGVFDLLRARQAEYDAYQAYLEAVRDYWTARAHLRATVGGRLPDDDAITGSARVDVDPMMPQADAGGDEATMHEHGHGAHHMEAEDADDPHAAHRIKAEDADDPHAAHRTEAEDPHAAHRKRAQDADDPHAAHRAGAKPPEDPHAGHAMPPAAASGAASSEAAGKAAHEHHDHVHDHSSEDSTDPDASDDAEGTHEHGDRA